MNKSKAILAALGATALAATTTTLAFGQDFSPVGGAGGKGGTGGRSQGELQGESQGTSQGVVHTGAQIGVASTSNVFSRGSAHANTTASPRLRGKNSNRGSNGGKGGRGGNAGNHF